MEQLARQLGFSEATHAAFHFLEQEHGMEVVRDDPDWIRYENERRFVDVSFDRYELDVRVGKVTPDRGDRNADRVSLNTIVTHYTDPSTAGVPAYMNPSGAVMVSDRTSMAQILSKLAGLTRKYAAPLLADNDALFEEIHETQRNRPQDEVNSGAAAQYRNEADDAWRRGDFTAVERAYTRMLSEVPLVELRPAEQRRLDYARRNSME